MKINGILRLILWLVPALIPLCFLFHYLPARSFPSEDAAMLFQYSENLADTGCISYNRGGPPVEGATDFLWMVILSLFHKAGADTYMAAVTLSALALLFSAWLLMRLSGRRRPAVFALAVLSLLAVPQVFAAVQGFSPIFFGTFILLAFYGFLNNLPALIFSAAILTCLIRPDGVVFAVPLTAVFLAVNSNQLKSNLIKVVLIAVIPGCIYFIWRYNYFDSFLPLPFYVKSTFERFALIFNAESLKLNLQFFAALCPLLLFAFFGLLSAPAEERALLLKAAVALLAVPFLFYSCMHLEQNLAYRFQYPFVLISLALAAAAVRYAPHPMLGLPALLLSLAFMAPWYAVEGVRTLSMPSENIPYLSKALGNLPCHGRIATTEAGRLPYYSGWETVDLWGLNTKALARDIVTPEFIHDFNPDLVVLHPLHGYYGDDYRFLLRPIPPAHKERGWQNMLDNTMRGMGTNGYELVMVPHMTEPPPGNPFRNVVPLRKEIQQKLGYQGKFDVYYAFFIRRDSNCYQPLKAMLPRFGAISFDQYRANKQKFIEDRQERVVSDE